MPKSRTAIAALALVAGWSLAACGPGTPGEPEETDGRPVVMATFTVVADIAREVAGDYVQVESLTAVGAEIHGYEPTPSDIQRASRADLILDNGLGLEAWFERFLTQVDAPRVTVSEGVTPIPIASDAAAGQPNPHAWMSPREATGYVDTIVRALSDLAPEHAADFEAEGARFRGELDQLASELDDALATLPASQRVLVTCEGAFSYLARDGGLDEVYLWPVNAESEATARSIAAAIDVVRERDVPAVFCESTVSDRAMQQVVEATDATYGGELYVDSLSLPDGPVPSYVDLLRHDVDLIVSGLTGGES